MGGRLSEAGGRGTAGSGCGSAGGVDWVQVLGQLGASEEWGQLQRELGASPGGGELVSSLMQRALREAAQQAQQLGSPGGGGAGGASCGDGPSGPPGQQGTAGQLVAAVQQAAWEKLHSGSWHEVGMVWRDAYSAACLLAAAGALLWPAAPPLNGPGAAAAAAAEGLEATQQRQEEAGEGAAGAASEAQPLREALRELDMAAIMGGSLLRPAVDALIDQLQASWQRLGKQRQQQQQQQQVAASGAAGDMGAGQGAALRAASPGGRGGGGSDEAGGGEAGGSGGTSVVPLPPGSLGPRGTPVPAEELPSLERFWREYMQRPGGPIPVLIEGAMEVWPALRKWGDIDYLRSVAGPRTVPVEVGENYLAEQWGQQLMTLEEFIGRYIPEGAGGGGGAAPSSAGGALGEGAASSSHPQPQPRGYLAQHPLFEQIPALAADIREPEYCVLGEGEVQSVNAWFGPPGTVTPLHTDPHHNLLCQVVGSKYLRLYTPQDTPALYPFSEGMTTNSSQVELDAPDHARFPAFAGAPFRDCVLHAGQMLYIPPGWWHYVKALTTSFSVSYWWK